MKRIMGLTMQPEMMALWLIETSAVFLGFYALLQGTALLAFRHVIMAGPDFAALANALLLALVVGLVGVATGLYRLEICFATQRLLLGTAVTAAVSLAVVWTVAKGAQIDMSPMVYEWPAMLLAWLLLLVFTRLLYSRALRMDMFVRRVAVLGAPQAVAPTIEAISGINPRLYRVEAIQPPLGQTPTSTPMRLPDGLWGVVVTGHSAPVEMPAGARRFDAETFWEDQLGRIDVESTVRPRNASESADVAWSQAAPAPVAAWPAALIRRLLDMVVAAFLLLFLAPVLLATALAIRMESAGPVIYRQERVGLGGRVFTLWKFRSMRADAEHAGPRWASVDDPRITVVGRFIRKVRIDELPQMVNILRGDMSLVGPRPERPHFVEQLAHEIPVYRQRALVKPGLTGWAQVSYPYGASVEDARAKLSYDLYYVKHRSLLFDLLIMLSTVRVILFQEGAR
jgi:lipopolysaccharide/colanic/teichoic acid biosynthesis glycosyltransferase